MSYLQAFIIAVVQGVTELFPVSSLGHSVLIPAWIGGSWQTMVTQSSQASSETSFYLAYIVALHCATALALLWFFRADWARITRGFFRSLLRGLRDRRLSIQGPDERLAWMIMIATIPVGLTGIALEHTFRDSLYIGVLQITALLAGISRSGVTMPGGCAPSPGSTVTPLKRNSSSTLRPPTSVGRGWIMSQTPLPWTATSSARCWSRLGSARRPSMRSFPCSR